jgi:homeobox-leucine zipper protein
MALKGGSGGAGGGAGGRQEAASELINLNVVKETEASCSNRSENSSEINLGISRPSAPPADESTMNSHRAAATLPFYASAVGGSSGGGSRLDDIDQLLQHSHASSAPKMELGHGGADTGAATAGGAASFGSLLCGGAVVDEQPPFWPWAADGHHNFQ